MSTPKPDERCDSSEKNTVQKQTSADLNVAKQSYEDKWTQLLNNSSRQKTSKLVQLKAGSILMVKICSCLRKCVH